MSENRHSRYLHCTQQLVQWGGRENEHEGVSVIYQRGPWGKWGQSAGSQNDFLCKHSKGQVFLATLHPIIDNTFILCQRVLIIYILYSSLWLYVMPFNGYIWIVLKCFEEVYIKAMRNLRSVAHKVHTAGF